MQRVVKIHAGQNGEDIGLKSGNEKLKRRQGNDHEERQDHADKTDCTHCQECQDETREHLQHDVSGQHAGEKTDRVADGTREIRDDLNRKSTRLNSSHVKISYAVFCLKKKKKVNKDR